MRPALSLVAALLASSAPLAAMAAEDLQPPGIGEVHARATAGVVLLEARITDETGVLAAVAHYRTPGGDLAEVPLVKDELDDVFRARFPGGPGTRFWLEATDLLGNGPARFGSEANPKVVEAAKASQSPARRGAPPATVAAGPKRARPAPPTSGTGLTLAHIPPASPQPAGRPLALRATVRSAASISRAVVLWRPQGAKAQGVVRLEPVGKELWEGTLPAAAATGTVEYYVAARTEAGTSARIGADAAGAPFVLAFSAPKAPWEFAHNPPLRVRPGEPVHLRAQIAPPEPDGALPGLVEILWRDSEGLDHSAPMAPDATGGWGGVQVDLPAQREGALYWQIVACGGTPVDCAVDTGELRRWHAAAVTAELEVAPPPPLDAVSAAAPPELRAATKR